MIVLWPFICDNSLSTLILITSLDLSIKLDKPINIIKWATHSARKNPKARTRKTITTTIISKTRPTPISNNTSNSHKILPTVAKKRATKASLAWTSNPTTLKKKLSLWLWPSPNTVRMMRCSPPSNKRPNKAPRSWSTSARPTPSTRSTTHLTKNSPMTHTKSS